jgi:hypothetical protein
MATTKVTSSVLADDAVATAAIADDAVTTAKIADNAITNALMADDVVGVAELSATGSPSATTFLRGDNAWAAVEIDTITLGTQQAATSGTSIDFTSIPSGTKRITIMFNGVSTNGTSNILVQLGDAGGVEATGYVSSVSYSTTDTNGTAGFIVIGGVGAANVWNGAVTLHLMNAATFTWASNSVIAGAGAATRIQGGAKSLSAELDRVRITMANGTDTFDAGAINISYES